MVEELHWRPWSYAIHKGANGIFYDNEGVAALTKEPRDHGRSRHVVTTRNLHSVQTISSQ